MIFKKCIHCNKDFEAKHGLTKLCNRKCFYSHRHVIAKEKIWQGKLKVIKDLGGKCINCGISDIKVLEINHIDRSKKLLVGRKRASSYHRLKDWKANMNNLELLCANCHRIHTWEQMNYNIQSI